METTEPTVPEGFKVVKEGKASVLFSTSNEVFYNPAQVINRDLSILMIKNFDKLRKEEPVKKKAAASQAEPLKILEALSATGLRAIRYAKEIPAVGSIIANDLSQDAVGAIRRNVEFNGETEKVLPTHSDANVHMHMHKEAYHVVDLDPYGSASIFLDGAVQSVADGGLMCITCTDMAVLAGSHPEACYAKYASMSLHTRYCHEMALRIVLANLQSHAARYKRYIVPLLSLSIDFYVRLFVRVYTSPSEVKNSASKLSYVYQCVSCDSFHTQPVGKTTKNEKSIKYSPGLGPAVPEKCTECGGRFQVGGPIWHEPIHDQSFVRRCIDDLKSDPSLFAQNKKILGMLTAASEELPDRPFYYLHSSLFSRLHASCPPASTIRSALLNAGFRVSSSHANPDAIKTDAPPKAIWDILRCWIKDHPVKNDNPNTPGFIILSKEPELKADFTYHSGAGRSDGVARWLPNPEENWGPKPRAGRKLAPAAAAGGPSETTSTETTETKQEKRPLATEDTPQEEGQEAKRQKMEEESA